MAASSARLPLDTDALIAQASSVRAELTTLLDRLLATARLKPGQVASVLAGIERHSESGRHLRRARQRLALTLPSSSALPRIQFTSARAHGLRA
jgi:hypothetical protein